MDIVRLPRDGAAYHCTWEQDGKRCGLPTKHGIANQELLDAARKLLPNVYFLRALCTGHMERVAEEMP